MVNNEGIRRTARAERIPLWQIAARAGISENTLLRWLRIPLEGEHLTRVTAALQALVEQQQRRGGYDADE